MFSKLFIAVVFGVVFVNSLNSLVINPDSGGLYGGMTVKVEITGAQLSNGKTFKVYFKDNGKSKECANPRLVSSTVIECTVPPKPGDFASAVTVLVEQVVEQGTETWESTWTYNADLTLDLVSVDAAAVSGASGADGLSLTLKNAASSSTVEAQLFQDGQETAGGYCKIHETPDCGNQARCDFNAQCDVPPVAGLFQLRVGQPAAGGDSNQAPYQVNKNDQLYQVEVYPSIQSVSPVTASRAGGSKVTITGSGFSASSKVHLKYVDNECVVDSATDSQIVCTAPEEPTSSVFLNATHGSALTGNSDIDVIFTAPYDGDFTFYFAWNGDNSASSMDVRDVGESSPIATLSPVSSDLLQYWNQEQKMAAIPLSTGDQKKLTVFSNGNNYKVSVGVVRTDHGANAKKYAVSPTVFNSTMSVQNKTREEQTLTLSGQAPDNTMEFYWFQSSDEDLAGSTEPISWLASEAEVKDAITNLTEKLDSGCTDITVTANRSCSTGDGNLNSCGCQFFQNKYTITWDCPAEGGKRPELAVTISPQPGQACDQTHSFNLSEINTSRRLLQSSSCSAENSTWTKAANGTWHDTLDVEGTDDWSTDGNPNGNSEVTISGEVTVTTDFDGETIVKNYEVMNGATLVISAGDTLIASDNCTILSSQPTPSPTSSPTITTINQVALFQRTVWPGHANNGDITFTVTITDAPAQSVTTKFDATNDEIKKAFAAKGHTVDVLSDGDPREEVTIWIVLRSDTASDITLSGDRAGSLFPVTYSNKKEPPIANSIFLSPVPGYLLSTPTNVGVSVVTNGLQSVTDGCDNCNFEYADAKRVTDLEHCFFIGLTLECHTGNKTIKETSVLQLSLEASNVADMIVTVGGKAPKSCTLQFSIMECDISNLVGAFPAGDIPIHVGHAEYGDCVIKDGQAKFIEQPFRVDSIVNTSGVITSGLFGTYVTVIGVGFSSDMNLNFDGSNIAYTGSSHTEAVFSVPSLAESLVSDDVVSWNDYGVPDGTITHIEKTVSIDTVSSNVHYTLALTGTIGNINFASGKVIAEIYLDNNAVLNVSTTTFSFGDVTLTSLRVVEISDASPHKVELSAVVPSGAVLAAGDSPVIYNPDLGFIGVKEGFTNVTQKAVFTNTITEMSIYGGGHISVETEGIEDTNGLEITLKASDTTNTEHKIACNDIQLSTDGTVECTLDASPDSLSSSGVDINGNLEVKLHKYVMGEHTVQLKGDLACFFEVTQTGNQIVLNVSSATDTSRRRRLAQSAGCSSGVVAAWDDDLGNGKWGRQDQWKHHNNWVRDQNPMKQDYVYLAHTGADKYVHTDFEGQTTIVEKIEVTGDNMFLVIEGDDRLEADDSCVTSSPPNRCDPTAVFCADLHDAVELTSIGDNTYKLHYPSDQSTQFSINVYTETGLAVSHGFITPAFGISKQFGVGSNGTLNHIFWTIVGVDDVSVNSNIVLFDNNTLISSEIRSVFGCSAMHDQEGCDKTKSSYWRKSYVVTSGDVSPTKGSLNGVPLTFSADSNVLYYDYVPHWTTPDDRTEEKSPYSGSFNLDFPTASLATFANGLLTANVGDVGDVGAPDVDHVAAFQQILIPSVTFCQNFVCSPSFDVESSTSLNCAYTLSGDNFGSTCDFLVSHGAYERNYTFPIADKATVPKVTDIQPKTLPSLHDGTQPLNITFEPALPSLDNVTILVSGVKCQDPALVNGQVQCVPEQRTFATIGAETIQVNKASFGSYGVNEDVQFQFVDQWSALNSWQDNLPPGQDDTIVIPMAQQLILDTSPGVSFNLLLIQGKLIWDTSIDGIHLQSKYLYVQGGYFECGTVFNPMMNSATITLMGSRDDIGVPLFGTKMISVTDKCLNFGPNSDLPVDCYDSKEKLIRGEVSIVGAAVNSSFPVTMVTAPNATFSNTIEFDDKTLEFGDKFIIVSTYNGTFEVEVGNTTLELCEEACYASNATCYEQPQFNASFCESQRNGCLAACTSEGSSTSGLNYYNLNGLPDEFLCKDETGGPDSSTCQLLFLERKVQITAETTDEEAFGGHIVSAYGGKLTVKGAQISNCGKSGRYDRSCITMLHGEHSSSEISENTFNNTYQRAVTLRGVSNLKVSKNYAHNVRGHSFADEGYGESNQFTENVAISNKEAYTLTESDLTPAGFYMKTVDVGFSSNQAYNSAGSGFWFHIFEQSEGSPGFSFASNTASHNGKHGVDLHNMDDFEILEFNGHHNGGSGISTFGVKNIRVNSANVHDNVGSGINLAGVDEVRYFDDDVYWPTINSSTIGGNEESGPGLVLPNINLVVELTIFENFVNESGAIEGQGDGNIYHLKDVRFDNVDENLIFGQGGSDVFYLYSAKSSLVSFQGSPLISPVSVHSFRQTNNVTGCEQIDNYLLCNANTRVRVLKVTGVSPVDLYQGDVIITNEASPIQDQKRPSCPSGYVGSPEYNGNGYVGGCDECPPGTYLNPSGTDGPTCEDCGTYEYQPVSGSTACLTCASTSFGDSSKHFCVDPELVHQRRLLANDALCDPGSYYDNSTSAEKCLLCPVGTFSSTANSTSTSCEECPPGTYSNVGATECTTCEGTVEEDGTCTRCPLMEEWVEETDDQNVTTGKCEPCPGNLEGTCANGLMTIGDTRIIGDLPPTEVLYGWKARRRGFILPVVVQDASLLPANKTNRYTWDFSRGDFENLRVSYGSKDQFEHSVLGMENKEDFSINFRHRYFRWDYTGVDTFFALEDLNRTAPENPLSSHGILDHKLQTFDLFFNVNKTAFRVNAVSCVPEDVQTPSCVNTTDPNESYCESALGFAWEAAQCKPDWRTMSVDPVNVTWDQWFGAHGVPADGEPYVIKGGETVEIKPDGSNSDKLVTVEFLVIAKGGKLKFSKTNNVFFNVNRLLIYGDFEAGDCSSPTGLDSTLTHEITFTGDRRVSFDTLIGGTESLGYKAIGVYGNVSMCGHKTKAWNHVNEAIMEAKTNAFNSTGGGYENWGANDHVVISATRKAEDTEIQLYGAIWNSNDFPANEDGSLGPKIGRINRNVIVKSVSTIQGTTSSASQEFGGHIRVVGQGWFAASGVLFKNLGKYTLDHPVLEITTEPCEYDPLTNSTVEPGCVNSWIDLQANCFAYNLNAAIVNNNPNANIIGNFFFKTRRTAVEIQKCEDCQVIDNLAVTNTWQTKYDEEGLVLPTASFLFKTEVKSFSGNVAVGSVDAGFIYPPLACGSSQPQDSNQAIANLVGHFLSPSNEQCVEVSNIKAFSNVHLGVTTVDGNSSEFRLTDSHLSNNHIGAAFSFFHSGDGSVVKVDGCKIEGNGLNISQDCEDTCRTMTGSDPRAELDGCQSVIKNTHYSAGLLTPQYTSGGKIDSNYACSLTWEKKFGLPSVDFTSMKITNTQFNHWQPTCDNSVITNVTDYKPVGENPMRMSAIMVNPSQSDYSPLVEISGISYQNTDLEALYFMNTCENCDVANNAMFMEKVSGQETRNIIAFSNNVCDSDDVEETWNAKVCAGEFGQVTIREIVDDANADMSAKLLYGPLSISDAETCQVENCTMNAYGPQNDICLGAVRRDYSPEPSEAVAGIVPFNKFTFLAELGQTYKIASNVDRPRKLEIGLFSATAGTVKLQFDQPRSLETDVEVPLGFVTPAENEHGYHVIADEVLSVDLVTDSSYSTGFVSLVNTILSSTRIEMIVDMSLTEFFNDHQDKTFTEKLTEFLGIGSGSVSVAFVTNNRRRLLSESTKAKIEIFAETEVSGDSKEDQEVFLATILTQLTTQFESGTLSDILGVPVSAFVTISEDGTVTETFKVTATNTVVTTPKEEVQSTQKPTAAPEVVTPTPKPTEKETAKPTPEPVEAVNNAATETIATTPVASKKDTEWKDFAIGGGIAFVAIAVLALIFWSCHKKKKQPSKELSPARSWLDSQHSEGSTGISMDPRNSTEMVTSTKKNKSRKKSISLSIGAGTVDEAPVQEEEAPTAARPSMEIVNHINMFSNTAPANMATVTETGARVANVGRANSLRSMDNEKECVIEIQKQEEFDANTLIAQEQAALHQQEELNRKRAEEEAAIQQRELEEELETLEVHDLGQDANKQQQPASAVGAAWGLKQHPPHPLEQSGPAVPSIPANIAISKRKKGRS